MLNLTLSQANLPVGNKASLIVRLTQAQSNAVTVNLASTPAGIVNLASSTASFAPGKTQVSVDITGVSQGTATITARASGFKAITVSASVWPAAIPLQFFGMTIQNFSQVKPQFLFGTTRSWDAGVDIAWSGINVAPNVYKFTELDNFIAVNQARKAEIIYTFGRTPQWASSQPYNLGATYGPGQCAPPKDLGVWDAYVTAIVKHAAGKIKYWELWNEPNNPGFYCGDMPTLVTMAQHAYRIIKGIDPQALVLAPPMVSSSGPGWLGYFLYLGGAKYVDVIAFHGYASTVAEDISPLVSQYRYTMQANGVGNLPMWDTEASWAGLGNLATPSPGAQAAYLARSYLLHQSLGIQRFAWYAYDGGSTWGGLWTQSNGPSEAATAYAEIESWMVGHSFAAPCSLGAHSVWSCGLVDPATGDIQTIMWSTNGNQTVTMPGTAYHVQTLSNQLIQSGNKITVGEEPILISNPDTIAKAASTVADDSSRIASGHAAMLAAQLPPEATGDDVLQ
jgi:hypothetical protein